MTSEQNAAALPAWNAAIGGCLPLRHSLAACSAASGAAHRSYPL